MIKTRGPRATSLIWENTIEDINLVNVCLLFHNHLPLEKGLANFIQGCFVPSLVEIDPVALEKKIFKDFVEVFSLFHNNLPLEKSGAFIWTNVNLLHPRMLCAMFG